jgi:hypothetical protein
MKTQADLVKGWLRKADSDLTNAGLCIEREQALDTACFHAQPDASFFSIKTLSQELTRYDAEFWPALETAAQAWGAAMTIRDFVVERRLEEMRQG